MPEGRASPEAPSVRSDISMTQLIRVEAAMQQHSEEMFIREQEEALRHAQIRNAQLKAEGKATFIKV